MAQAKLTARFVTTTTKLGLHTDGGGLGLLVRKRGEDLERLWVFRFRRGPRGEQKANVLSLGPAHTITLAQAREKAAAARAALWAGEDPKRAIRPQAQQGLTFGEFADAFIDKIENGFRNQKHRTQWKMTLGETYCSALRKRGLAEIRTEHVLAVLQPIWGTKPETASRIRGRIERVLDAARAQGHREGENPARWRGHLDAILPKRGKLSRGHHAALDYDQMPDFMTKLRANQSMSAAALEFTILCAARTGEVIGAKWSEIDFEKRLWTIPAVRMKSAKEHRVPLCDRAIEILRELQPLGGEWIFSSPQKRKHLSNMAMLELIKGIWPERITAHGFRSTFRDWAGDCTAFPRDVVEAALAHTLSDKVEAAYRRSDALEKRRELMTGWERFCGGSTANVVQFKQAK